MPDVNEYVKKINYIKEIFIAIQYIVLNFK